MTGFVLGREIVADALRSGDVGPYLAAGLTLDFMRDDLHPAHASVFTGQDHSAWVEILDYATATGHAPDVKIFRQSFPEATYELPDTRVTTAELVGMAAHAIGQYEAEVGTADVTALVDAGDPTGAAKVMLDTARRILSRDNGGNIKLTVDDASFSLDAYLAETVTRGPGFGIGELDRNFGGFQDGHLITILGRAKANKTTFLIQSAYHAWAGTKVRSVHSSGLSDLEEVPPRRVLFVSTEIDAKGIQGRFLAYGAGVNHRYLTERTGRYRMTPEVEAKVREYWDGEIAPEDSQSIQVIQPTSQYTAADLEADIESFGAGMVCLDGFYFMFDPVTQRSPGSSWEAHDNLASALKNVAMRQRLPVVLTHQVREKQLGKAGGGIDDGAMMGGTGLRMASDLVITADKDADGIITLKNTASRSGYLPTIRGEWLWDTFEFQVHSSDEEGHAGAD